MIKNNCTESQRLRLLKKLRKKTCTTVEARHELDILDVAPRVHELRWRYGYNIQTQWTTETNPGGGQHRVAMYVLMPGKWRDANAKQ